jgi:hypothetical protein
MSRRILCRSVPCVALVHKRDFDASPVTSCTCVANWATCARFSISAGVTCNASRWPKVSTHSSMRRSCAMVANTSACRQRWICG